MMINTNCMLCRIKILLCTGKSFFVTGIQCDKKVICSVIFIVTDNLFNTLNNLIAVRNRFQSDIRLNIRIIISNIMPETHAGADTVTVRSCMTGNHDRFGTLKAGQDIIHCPLLLHALFLHQNEQRHRSVLTY